MESPRGYHLRWGAVSAVLSNPLGVVDFCSVENGDVVVAAVVISFHVKLLELHFNYLQAEKNGCLSFITAWSIRANGG